MAENNSITESSHINHCPLVLSKYCRELYFFLKEGLCSHTAPNKSEKIVIIISTCVTYSNLDLATLSQKLIILTWNI